MDAREKSSSPVKVTRIMFSIRKEGRKKAVVYFSRGEEPNKGKNVKWPTYIDRDSLEFGPGTEGKSVSIYDREGEYEYFDINNSRVPIQPLGQQLERFAQEFTNSIDKN